MEDMLRYAVYEDMDLLFEWANDEMVRKNSFSSHYITYEEHQGWYAYLLQRTDVRQYIYLHDNDAIGQIRVEANGTMGEISYSICRKYRGMGYGKKMLQLLTTQIKKDFPHVQKLQGKVKKNNTASQSAFIKSGFAKTGFETTYVLYELSL